MLASLIPINCKAVTFPEDWNYSGILNLELQCRWSVGKEMGGGGREMISCKQEEPANRGHENNMIMTFYSMQ